MLAENNRWRCKASRRAWPGGALALVQTRRPERRPEEGTGLAGLEPFGAQGRLLSKTGKVFLHPQRETLTHQHCP
jgi:hypothetical protein